MFGGFLDVFLAEADAEGAYDHFGGGIPPRVLLCVRKEVFNGHHRIFKGGRPGPPPSQIYGRRRMASHI